MRAARATIGGIVGALGFDQAESHGLLPHRWVARGRQRELNIAEHDTRNLVRSDPRYRVVRMIPGLHLQRGLLNAQHATILTFTLRSDRSRQRASIAERQFRMHYSLNY